MYSGKSQMEEGGNSVVTFCRRDQLFIGTNTRFLPHFQVSLSHNEDGVCSSGRRRLNPGGNVCETVSWKLLAE